MTVFDEFNEVKRKGLPQILVIFGESKEMVQELKSQLLTFVNFEPTDLSQSYYDLTPNNSDLALEDLESLPNPNRGTPLFMLKCMTLLHIQCHTCFYPSNSSPQTQG